MGPKSKQILHTLGIGERRSWASIHSSGGDISETSAPEQIKAAIKLRTEFTAKLFFPKLAAFISSRRSPAFYIKQHTHIRETRSLGGAAERASAFYFLTDGAQPRAGSSCHNSIMSPRERSSSFGMQQKSFFVGFYTLSHTHMQSATHSYT